jgi:hypothetical protein
VDAALACVPNGGAHGDAITPPGQAFTPERADALEDLHQDNLGGVFRIEGIAQDGQGDALHPSMQPIHQSMLSIPIASGRLGGQCDGFVVVGCTHAGL